MGRKTIYICDRCGQEMDLPCTIAITGIGERNETIYIESSIALSDAGRDIYLCKDCAIKFRKFMREENKK